MKRILIGSAAAISLLSVSGAMAADMAPRYTKAPVAVAIVYDWTGFYIGGNAGYSWGRGSTDQTDTTSVTTNTRLFRGTTPPANEIMASVPLMRQPAYSHRIRQPA
jgi:outer membrane immunogenic protein